MKFDTPGKRILFLRNLCGLTRKDFQEKYQIPIGTIRLWEDTKKIKEKAADRFLSALHQEGIECTRDWIVSGKGQIPSINDFYHIKSTDVSILGDNFDEDIAIEISYLQRKFGNAFISMVVNDDSNHPFLSVGDYVGGLLGKNKNELINQLCIVEAATGIILIRQLIASAHSDQLHLKAFNPNIEFPISYNQTIKNIWKIIWIRKRQK